MVGSKGEFENFTAYGCTFITVKILRLFVLGRYSGGGGGWKATNETCVPRGEGVKESWKWLLCKKYDSRWWRRRGKVESRTSVQSVFY